MEHIVIGVTNLDEIEDNFDIPAGEYLVQIVNISSDTAATVDLFVKPPSEAGRSVNEGDLFEPSISLDPRTMEQRYPVFIAAAAEVGLRISGTSQVAVHFMGKGT